jgi:acetyl esterase
MQLSPRTGRIVVRGIYGLPAWARHALAGRAIRVDGQRLDPDLQLMMRLQRIGGRSTDATQTPEQRRLAVDSGTQMIAGDQIGRVATRDLFIPADWGSLPARLYIPESAGPASALLVYFHGGGWVLGSLDSHDALCRFLATRAGVRVLSVAYRLAPEHPFPAGVDDALTGFRYARDHASELGADPTRVAIGGDSAGANLAAVTGYQCARAGEPGPVFALLFYPAVDAINRAPSRDLFSTGFYLTDDDGIWFDQHYVAPGTDRSDPRLSILLAHDLSGLPPTYLVTAGLDPLRDEGEAFAAKLEQAGVPVVLRRQYGLMHGFASMFGVSDRCREAVAEAAGALRTGLGLIGAVSPPSSARRGQSQSYVGPR